MKACPKILGAALVGLSAIAMSSLTHPMPRLLWNASASVPVGLYAVHPVGMLMAGELLVVKPPAALAQFMAERRYLPPDVPLVKHVAALPGQTVCRAGHTITIGGIAKAEALEVDTRHRELPVWQGCRAILSREVFLMNAGVFDSFDGRYFGPIPDSTIIGRATPLWLPGKQSARNPGQ